MGWSTVHDHNSTTSSRLVSDTFGHNVQDVDTNGHADIDNEPVNDIGVEISPLLTTNLHVKSILKHKNACAQEKGSYQTRNKIPQVRKESEAQK